MNLRKLREKQLDIAKKAILKDSLKLNNLKTIGGFDLAFNKNKIICAAIVLDYNTLELLEKRYIICKEEMPYIPTFLTFREGPPIIKVYKKLKIKPDILLFDGNGILHPFKVGIATHIGVILKKSSIGVAKSLLCGKVKNNYVYIGDEKVGYELKRGNFKPIYISPGNRISLKRAVGIVKKLIRNNKLPEPLRLAHLYADDVKRLR